jgi:hypothetical protein
MAGCDCPGNQAHDLAFVPIRDRWFCYGNEEWGPVFTWSLHSSRRNTQFVKTTSLANLVRRYGVKSDIHNSINYAHGYVTYFCSEKCRKKWRRNTGRTTMIVLEKPGACAKCGKKKKVGDLGYMKGEKLFCGWCWN